MIRSLKAARHRRASERDDEHSIARCQPELDDSQTHLLSVLEAIADCMELKPGLFARAKLARFRAALAQMPMLTPQFAADHPRVRQVIERIGLTSKMLAESKKSFAAETNEEKALEKLSDLGHRMAVTPEMVMRLLVTKPKEEKRKEEQQRLEWIEQDRSQRADALTQGKAQNSQGGKTAAANKRKRMDYASLWYAIARRQGKGSNAAFKFAAEKYNSKYAKEIDWTAVKQAKSRKASRFEQIEAAVHTMTEHEITTGAHAAGGRALRAICKQLGIEW